MGGHGPRISLPGAACNLKMSLFRSYTDVVSSVHGQWKMCLRVEIRQHANCTIFFGGRGEPVSVPQNAVRGCSWLRCARCCCVMISFLKPRDVSTTQRPPPVLPCADQAPAPQAVQEPQEPREDRVPCVRRIAMRGLRAAAVSFKHPFDAAEACSTQHSRWWMIVWLWSLV